MRRWSRSTTWPVSSRRSTRAPDTHEPVGRGQRPTAAVSIAVGGDLPTTASDLGAGVAALLASYPLIDAVASIAAARNGATSGHVLRVNAAISAAAVVAIAVTGFGSDAGATLASFGAWAAISGASQLGVAIHQRRSQGGQLPMIVSGGLSTIAGLGFIAQSGGNDAHVSYIAGYMALGALLYLLRRSADGHIRARLNRRICPAGSPRLSSRNQESPCHSPKPGRRSCRTPAETQK